MAKSHPLDIRKDYKQFIKLWVPQQQNNSLGLPLNSTNKQRSLYNPLNVELCSTTAKQLAVYPSALPLQPKVGFIPVNLSTRNRNLPTHLQNFNWLLQRQQILERNRVKWRQSAERGEWAFPCGQHTPSPDFRARSMHAAFHNLAI